LQPNIKDLGVSIDNSLSFSNHINTITMSAKIIVFRIFKSFITKDFDALMKAYKYFVRPLLEYCSTVWNPYHVNEINKIESVQKLFTRKLFYPEVLPYNVRLLILKLETLEKRRLISDLIFCFKLLNKKIAGSLEDYGLRLCTPTTALRGNSMKLYISHSRIDSRKYFFATRISKTWNSLNDDIIRSPTVAHFKTHINKTDLSKFLSY
jgi:hypothetical protein